VNPGGIGRLTIHTLHPRGRILRQYTNAAAACLIPLFLVLYYLAIPVGAWLLVLVVQLVAMAAVAYCVVAYRRIRIDITPARVSERRFFGRTGNFAVDDVDNVILLELYRGDALDTHPQLFLVDANGSVLLRMRGQFWSRSAMDTVVEHLDAPVMRVPEPLTIGELHRMRPELLSWFERPVFSRSP
jgi:hypothetical protein